jgi:hypothetical protein
MNQLCLRRQFGRAATSRRLLGGLAVASLMLAACSSTAPSDRPPPTIAGAWEGVVNNVRITLDLTETPSPNIFGSGTVLTSFLDVGGSGTLTSLSHGESASIGPSGTNYTKSTGGQTVLINFFDQSPLVVGNYGQFNGAISGSMLVGIVHPAGISLGSFFGPESVTAVFSRP